TVLLRVALKAGMQKPWNPTELTINIPAADNFAHLVHGCRPGFPEGLGRITTKNFDEVIKPCVGDISEVSGGVSGVGCGAALPLQKSDFHAFFFEEICGGYAG